MSLKTLVSGAAALLAGAVPSLASAQEVGGYPQAPYDEAPYVAPEAEYTAVTVVPPAYGAVYLYDGRWLVGRFDAPGSMWLPTGRSYRVVAWRSGELLWNGAATTTGAPLTLRWAQPRPLWMGTPYPYPYGYRVYPYGYGYTPPRVILPPVERWRRRMPW